MSESRDASLAFLSKHYPDMVVGIGEAELRVVLAPFEELLEEFKAGEDERIERAWHAGFDEGFAEGEIQSDPY